MQVCAFDDKFTGLAPIGREVEEWSDSSTPLKRRAGTARAGGGSLRRGWTLRGHRSPLRAVDELQRACRPRIESAQACKYVRSMTNSPASPRSAEKSKSGATRRLLSSNLSSNAHTCMPERGRKWNQAKRRESAEILERARARPDRPRSRRVERLVDSSQAAARDQCTELIHLHTPSNAHTCMPERGRKWNQAKRRESAEILERARA
jgi:hypothetical protein